MRKGTGTTTWQLSSPVPEPTFAAGGQARFDFNDVPDRNPSGPLANYITAIILTFVGALVNAGESPDPVQAYDLPGLLIDTLQLQNCWHGTPISSDYWLGTNLRIHEYIGNGYQLGQRIPGAITPGAGPGTPASFSVRIPLCQGQLERDTALLALLYNPASLIVQMADSTVLDTASSGTTFAGTVVCSVELDARPEIVLGTPIEWVLHRQLASAANPLVQIKGFGRNSKMTGVEEKGGVVALMELSSAGNPSLGGVFTGDQIESYGFDWRGQNVTNDPRSFLNSQIAMIPDYFPGIPTRSGTAATDDASNERTVFPYFGLSASNGADPLNVELLAWLMALPGMATRLTDLETAQNDETYRLEAGGGGFAAGDHLTLAAYAKRWTDGKRAAFVRKVQVMNDPSCLASYVLGQRWQSAVLSQRAPTDKHTLTADEMTYCAWQLEAPGA